MTPDTFELTTQTSIADVLRESWEKVCPLFENLLAGYAFCRMIYDSKGHPEDFVYLDVNRAFEQIAGAKNVTGKRVTEVLPEIKEAFPEVLEIYGRVAMSGMPETFDLDFRPVGKWLHISVYSPSKQHFVAIFEDILLHRTGGDALAPFKIFTENAYDMILFIRKRDGRIIEANKAAAVAYGYTRGEILGMTIFELRAADKIQNFMHQMDRAAKERTVFEALHRRKDGSDLPVEASSASIVIEDEEVLVSILRDISERKRAEEYIRLLARMFDDAPASITIQDTDGNILYANEETLRLHGFTREEFLAKNMHEIDVAESGHLNRAEWMKEILEGGVADFDVQHLRKDGSPISLHLNVKIVDWGNKKGLLSIATNLTEREQAENALVIANTKLNILNSITRHDIVNQLTQLEGFLELYHETCKEMMEDKGYFDRLMGIAKIIEDQITFTKFYQEFGVRTPVWQHVKDIALAAARTGGFDSIRFTIEDIPFEIFADPLFEKVFFNLYDNSIRHGKHVTGIRVSGKFSGSDYIIAVDDDGIGVPAGDKARIFERNVGEHTGLGLFLVQDILALTGITIRETGEYEKGARFEMLVPKGAYRFKERP
jgi:PAS domain S-box-containing protein